MAFSGGAGVEGVEASFLLPTPPLPPFPFLPAGTAPPESKNNLILDNFLTKDGKAIKKATFLC